MIVIFSDIHWFSNTLIALLNLSSLCLVMFERLFLAVPRGCLQFVIVVFPDQTHLLFYIWTSPQEKPDFAACKENRPTHDTQTKL